MSLHLLSFSSVWSYRANNEDGQYSSSVELHLLAFFGRVQGYISYPLIIIPWELSRSTNGPLTVGPQYWIGWTQTDGFRGLTARCPIVPVRSFSPENITEMLKITDDE